MWSLIFSRIQLSPILSLLLWAPVLFFCHGLFSLLLPLPLLSLSFFHTHLFHRHGLHSSLLFQCHCCLSSTTSSFPPSVFTAPIVLHFHTTSFHMATWSARLVLSIIKLASTLRFIGVPMGCRNAWVGIWDGRIWYLPALRWRRGPLPLGILASSSTPPSSLITSFLSPPAWSSWLLI